MKTIRFTFDNLNLVVDSLKSAGSYRVVGMVQDAVLEEAQTLDKCFHRGMFNLPGHFAPVIKSLLNFLPVAEVIHDYGHIVMSFAEGDFVDGQHPQIMTIVPPSSPGPLD